jgi:hypothetical protein
VKKRLSAVMVIVSLRCVCGGSEQTTHAPEAAVLATETPRQKDRHAATP